MFNALPNLHAAVLHGPIVLLPLAVLAHIVSLLRPNNKTLAGVSVTVWVLATLATGLTFLAGRWAADGLVDVSPQAMLRIGKHADLAWWVLVAASSALVLRLGAVAAAPRIAARALSGGALAVGLVLMPLIVLTGDAGGTLVFDYGLGTRVPAIPCPECEAPEEVGPRAPLTTSGDIVTFAPSQPERPFTALGDMETGGLVRLDHEDVTVLFDGTWDDVQLNAWLDLSGFDGTVRLLHHVGERSGAFTIASEGTALVGPDGTVLDRSEQAPPSNGAFAVNVAGEHLKGLVDGKTVTHGHGTSGPPGAAGIQFSGDGQVVIRRMEAIRLTDD